MYLSAVQPYVVAIIIAIIVVQYALALFCLLKLAYLDISKKQYVLWNLFILLVFFVGDAAFLIYYFKVGKNKKIPPFVPPVESDEKETSENDAKTTETEEAEKGGDTPEKNNDNELNK